ncbi:MAG: TlpA disulfide reductase family protein [Ferruginibacter sp.]|nr:TlpA disulfide reductase family protein [Ferruginibacter sp.]
MKKFSRFYAELLLLTYVSFLLVSCSGSTARKQADQPSVKQTESVGGEFAFNTDAATVLKDFKTWWSYHYQNIHLSEDFVGLDVDSTVISKEQFLVELTYGKFIPIRMGFKDNVSSYKLHPLKNIHSAISFAMKDDADRLLKQYRMEGTQLPAFKFVDLEGKTYDRENTRGKTLVLKCWFIHCVACVEEFPALNALVEEYKDRPDVLFVSLAMDQAPALKSFLDTRPFKYAVVADQDNFMTQELQATHFPTHLIVDKSGKIRKVVNRCDEMVPALKKLVAAS